MTPALFTPFQLRDLTLKNRIVISPMCQYSATEGLADDWHMAQYGRFAMGGAGLVILEATAVSPEGRITAGDLGLWEDAQVPGLARIAGFLKAQGAAAGIQLGHAGRKASAQRPWHGNGPLGQADIDAGREAPWPTVAPSALPVAENWPTPAALDMAGIERLKSAYAQAAHRALAAGFDVVELHAAHGYLLHQFLSPLSNRRDDLYGGDAAGRMRLPLEIAQEIRAIWPAGKPVFIRVSAVDHIDGGLEIEDTIAFAAALKSAGIDLVDCSSGGLTGAATAGRVPRGLGFQTGYAQAVRQQAGIASMAVGLILDAAQAEDILTQGRADLIAIGRAALDDPNWPLHAHRALCGETYDIWPPQSGWWLERRAAILRALDT